MATVSVILPSLRPHAVARVVKEFTLTNATTDYELIIVSPFQVKGEKVVHVLEQERRGVIFAVNHGYKFTSGEYIVVWSDDASPENNCLENMLNFVKSTKKLFVASFRRRSVTGKESEQWGVYGKLYAGWLCASKKTLEELGGLFDSDYENYWADPDLSLRAWTRGGEVGVCPNAWIKVTQIEDEVKDGNLNLSFDRDTKVFFDRWHSKFGKNPKQIWTDINLPIPHSFGGEIRAVLRKIPYLKSIKQTVLSVAKKCKFQNTSKLTS